MKDLTKAQILDRSVSRELTACLKDATSIAVRGMLAGIIQKLIMSPHETDELDAFLRAKRIGPILRMKGNRSEVVRRSIQFMGLRLAIAPHEIAVAGMSLEKIELRAQYAKIKKCLIPL